MEVVKERSGDVMLIRVSGRLDNHWSQPFDDAIEEMIREGAHHLRVDLTNVNYLSSAGVGVLMNAYRETKSLHGSFVITAASDRVRTVLQLVSLDTLLFATSEEPAPIAPRAPVREIQTEHALFECHVLHGVRFAPRFIGDPAAITRGFSGASAISVGGDTFALGVGAIGQNFDECRNLFGEFVAAAGTVAYMPTDGTTTPDYMSISGNLVPELQALYAIAFHGAPGHVLRFEAGSNGAVPLREIVSTCAEVAGTVDFGIVIAAEVAGLVCTRLRRSPVAGDASMLEFPAVRDWLSYLPEREHARTSCLVTGFASSAPSDSMRAFVRPVSAAHHGHFHAAVTAFRSLPRGKVDIGEVIAQAFQARSVLTVVHLLRDDRPIEGAGESEFQRGACWVFPLPRTAGGAA